MVIDMPIFFLTEINNYQDDILN